MATTAKGYPYPVGTDRVMDGDDVIHALADAINAQLGATAAGRVTVVTTGSAPSNGVTAVTFPAGRFNVAPRVLVSQASQIPAAATDYSTPYTSSVTTTGFNANVRRNDAQSVLVDWFATSVDL